VAIVVALLAAPTPLAAAQETVPPAPPSDAMVQGRVTTPGPTSEIGVPGVWVTVHRVGPDAQGPLDSVRTDATGRYSVKYRRFGSDEALYFAATVHRGIAYFSAPLRPGLTRGDDAAITVFETTTHPVAFTVQGHHIVVSAPGPDGARNVVEVYELSNDTTVTAVGKDSLTPVWSAPIPRAASRFAGGQGDVASSSLEKRDGRVVMTAAFGPGVKQLSYSYSLPESAFPLRFRNERLAVVEEVLLEEPGAQARAASLRARDSVHTQGHTFKRFLAQGVPAGEELRIDVPTAAAGTRTRVLIALAVLFVLAMGTALARALVRRTPGTTMPATVSPSRTESLAAAIAALDARRDAGDATLDAARYASERADLKAQLADALAAERATA
jgi:hypothetical protein